MYTQQEMAQVLASLQPTWKIWTRLPTTISQPLPGVVPSIKHIWEVKQRIKDLSLFSIDLSDKIKKCINNSYKRVQKHILTYLVNDFHNHAKLIQEGKRWSFKQILLEMNIHEKINMPTLFFPNTIHKI